MTRELLPFELQVSAWRDAARLLRGCCTWSATSALSLRDSPGWLLSTGIVLVFAVYPRFLETVARAIAVQVPANALFALAIVYLALNVLSLTIALSNSQTRARRIAQECALLRAELDDVSPHDGEAVRAMSAVIAALRPHGALAAIALSFLFFAVRLYALIDQHAVNVIFWDEWITCNRCDMAPAPGPCSRGSKGRIGWGWGTFSSPLCTASQDGMIGSRHSQTGGRVRRRGAARPGPQGARRRTHDVARLLHPCAAPERRAI